MTVQEGLPGLGGWLSTPDCVLGYGGLGDLDTEQPKFPMHAGSAPEHVLLREPANEGTNLRGNRRSPAATTAGFPGPVEAKAPSVLAHQGIRLKEDEGAKTTGPNAVERDPENALIVPDAKPSAVFGGDHRQLLAQRKKFEVE